MMEPKKMGKCPVCGRDWGTSAYEVYYYLENGDIVPSGLYVVDCSQCHTQTDKYPTLEDAILAWDEKRFHTPSCTGGSFLSRKRFSKY